MTNDGSFSWTFTVPADMPVGSEICVKDVLLGRSNVSMPTQVSNTICFRSAAALPVTTTTAPPTTVTTATTPTSSDADVSPSGTGTGGDVILSQPATDPAPLVELPRTGSGNGSLALAGVLAMLLGGLLVALGRRRSAGSQA
jgi:LPXTG-motif cell wall-anchored protein